VAVTIRDVSRLAGVSQATAARALGGYGHVSGAARRDVEAAAVRLGYVPNSVARALASGLTWAVGLVVGDIENPFFAAAARGMSDVLEERGHTVLLANSDEDLDRERQAIETLRARRVDGLVVVPSDSITVDNATGARSAIEHLISHGHRRIGLVSDEPEIPSSAERISGYYKALSAAGISADEHLVSLGGPTRHDGYLAARRLLEAPDRPTALFTANNFMTVGAMHALRDLGLRIPQDISLVGFDDMEWTTLVDPPLTVVSQPATDLGQEAGRRVLARLDGADGRPKRIKLRTQLIVRASCASPS
jgi:LacI family transcriptional regulator